MNKLSYKINKDDLFYTSPTSNEGFEIVLDNLPTKYFFDIEEFGKSLENEGIYGIFDGPCLLKGCCGIYMDVIHEEDKIIWKRFFITGNDPETRNYSIMPDGNDAYEAENFIMPYEKRVNSPLEFDKKEYEKLIQKLRVHGKK